MLPPRKPSNESERQAAVDELLIADPALERAFERVTHLVATQLHVPISAFTIVDRDRQCFKSIHGLDVQETPRDVSFCGHTILRDEIFVISDARRHKAFRDNPLVTGEVQIGFYAGAPVHSPNRQRVGSLCAIDNKPRKMTRQMRSALLDLRDILEALILLLTMSVRDHLTGLSNRRHFDEVIDREWHRACRNGLPIALLTIDIDYFKRFNDTYGHPAGDECLRRLAGILRMACKRSGDMPFRTGGEEFAVLLAETSGKQGARELAAKLQASIHDLAIPHAAAPLGIVTTSIGIASAEFLPRDGRGLEEFILCSDDALYAAKAQGRDRIVAQGFEQSAKARKARGKVRHQTRGPDVSGNR